MQITIIQNIAKIISAKINWFVERTIAVLMLLLVLDVWIGVIDRYIFHWQLSFPEIIARYLMIWMALLAISAGIARREHIGLASVVVKIPRPYKQIVLVIVEFIAFVMFMMIAYYGLDLVEKGMKKHIYIFSLTMFLPYLALPVSMGLAGLQTLLCAIRDLGDYSAFKSAEHIE